VLRIAWLFGIAAFGGREAVRVWKLPKVEALRNLPSFDDGGYNVASAVDDAVDDIATNLEYPTNQATTTRLRDRITFVGRKVHLHHIDAVHFDYWEDTDVGRGRYVNVRGCDQLLE
jgi:hypothetical protein